MASSGNDIPSLTSAPNAMSTPDLAVSSPSNNSEVIQSDPENRSGDLNNPPVHSVLGEEFSDSKNKILPRRLSITYPSPSISQPDVETEVCHVGNSECAQVSVIKAELNIGSDGTEEENYLLEDQSAPNTTDTSTTHDNTRLLKVMDSESQVGFPVSVPLETPTLTNLVAINPKYIPSSSKPNVTKRSPRGRKPSNVGSKLNKVVSKLILAKSNTNESVAPSILQNLLRNSPLNESELADNQCLQNSDALKQKKTASKLLPPVVPESLRLPTELVIIPRSAINMSSVRTTPINVCDNLPKIPNCTIPSPVVNRLRKLGTVVEVEGTSSVKNDIASRFTQLFDSMAQADNILSDLTKKKKKKTTKKVQEVNHKVPSNVLVENSEADKFYFQVDKSQVMELPEGQKLFTCDICSGVYYRGFSLKRHYLKTHINSKHVSARDLHNCGILIDKSAVENGARGRPKIESPPIVTNLSDPKNIIPDLYRCHNCSVCFPDKNELKVHLMDHPPISLETINEKEFTKTYRCDVCLLHFQKKKQYLRHTESCSKEVQNLTYHCLYCEKSFTSFEFKKKHQWKMHHPKKRLHPCYICKMKMFKDLTGLLKHLIVFHRDEYFGCLLCKLRFSDRSEFKMHKKEKHVKEKKPELQNKTTKTEGKAGNTQTNNSGKEGVNFKCTCCPKTFNEYVKMTRHRRLVHSVPNKKNKNENKTDLTDKVSELPSSNVTPSLSTPITTIIDPETIFYSRISLNIRENLLHHLDGKLDSQEVMEYDLKSSSSMHVNRNKVLNFSASFTAMKGSLEKNTILTTKDDIRPSHPIISPKVPWEKFNFPKNYDGRCGLTSYIKDMSHLDIATQLTMRRNLQRFNCCLGQENSKDVINEDIPSGLSLERQGAACAETFGDPETSSAKNLEGMPELSGEWIRPRTYICAACGLKSGSLWEIEDHKASLHPNVWCPHIEVVGEHSSVWDWVYSRSLPTQSISAALPLPPVVKPIFLPKCTKCGLQCSSTPDLHRHLLECGGDTTWMATMLAVTSPGSRRSRKWRPFGSRRRRQQGRRGMKRNIPNTPTKHLCGKIRTKPGDTDTIQKMIANLPPKRVTRKVIDEIDIKTRSQATINSVPFNVFSYTNKPPSLNGKTNKSGKQTVNKTPSVTGKKTKSNEISENKKEDSATGKKSTTKPEASVCSFTDDVNGAPQFADFVKLNEIPTQQKMETEVTVQHSDILTSLQMIPVVRKEVPDNLKESEGPIETSAVLAAMREAMDAAADVPVEKVFKKKPKDKRKKESSNENLIICNGCGMQFENASACLRHKKKCVYWKQENSTDQSSTNKCSHCNTVFPYLMALLTHDCKIGKINDEPSMPELIREEPVEEIKSEGVEDIPILSPEEIKEVNIVKYEESKHNRSVILLETTIDAVAKEDFIIEEFHLKKGLFKVCFGVPEETDLKRCSTDQFLVSGENLVKKRESEEIQSPVKLEPVEPPKNKKSKTSESSKKNKEPNKKSIEKEATSTNNIKHGKKSEVKTSVKNIKLSSEQNSKEGKIMKTKIKNLKDRKKKSLKGKLVVRSAIPNKGIKKNLNILKHKMKVIVRKRRSTNLDMLLQESEKLGEDGALISGKRRRHDSVNSGNFKIHSKTETPTENVKNKKKPGRPRKNNLVPQISSEVAGNKSVAEGENELTPVVKVKPKFKLSSLDRKTGKIVKYDSDSSVKELKLRQTNLDEMFEKSPSNNDVLVKDKTKTITTEDKKPKGRPKMKQTTLDLIQEKSLVSKFEGQSEKSKLPAKSNLPVSCGKTRIVKSADSKENLQLETSSQTKVNVLTGENSKVTPKKLESKQKNGGKSSKKNEEKEQTSKDDIDDPDEIPLSKIKVEAKEMNEGKNECDSKSCAKDIENQNEQTKRKTKTLPLKNSRHKCKVMNVVKTEMENNKQPDKEMSEENINITEEDRYSIKTDKLVNKINFKTCKDNNQKSKNDGANQEHISSLESETSDSLEWNTIDEVIANYGLEEAVKSASLSQRKKQRGRSSIPKNGEVEINSIKKKSKTSPSNRDKSNDRPVNTSKKKRSTDKSEQETIDSVVNAANICEIKSEKSDSVVTVSEDKVKNYVEERTVKEEKNIETHVEDKQSECDSNDDPDEDETLISLKRKLQSAKEETLKEDEQIIKKICTESIQDNSKNETINLSDSYLSKTVDKSKNKNKFKKFTNANKKFSKITKTSKKSSKFDDSFSGNSFKSAKVLGIKEKIKKKKKIKLRKIFKKGNLDMTEVTVKKVTKKNMSQSEQIIKKSPKFNDKLFKKLKKKHKFVVTGNKWQVSVVDSAANLAKTDSTTNVAEEEKEEIKEDSVISDTQFYCASCNEHFQTSFALYEHQSTALHKDKQTVEQPKDFEMCCNTLANVLNDLEEEKLQVAEVMNQLKHRESTDSLPDDQRSPGISNVSEVTNTSATLQSNIVPKKEHDSGSVETWPAQTSQGQDWVFQDWSMIRPTTPLWDSQQQPWEIESNFSSGCGSSLGSIFDTVNKILTEQDVSTQPVGLPQYTMADLQKAMGASDEEMAMLEQLGEGSLQEDYVYDNSRPGVDVWPKEEVPTFVDLDNQEPGGNAVVTSNQDAIVPTEPRSVTTPTETETDTRQCRGLLGRPQRHLSDYEMREMVCPTCNKHFLGLSALQTHVAWSHCAPVHSSSRVGGSLKRRALLNGCDEIDRRLVCFVCKEIVSSSSQLDVHIQAQHMKKEADGDKGSPSKEEGAEKLKNKMSNALGGLLDRALNNLLGSKQKPSETVDVQPELNSGALQLLGKLCAVRRRVGNENMKLSGDTLRLLGRLRGIKPFVRKEDTNSSKANPSFAKELRQVINRSANNTNKIPGVNKANLSASVTSEPANPDAKPTNLLDHLAVCSNDVEQKPYACPICDARFLIPSTRNRHIAKAHGKYGKKYDEEVQEQIAEQLAMEGCSNSTDDIYDNDWRDAFYPMLDEHNCDGEIEINPLCSDCGLSFRSIHDVIRHRKEDHPQKFLAEAFPEESTVLFNEELYKIKNLKVEETSQPSNSSSENILVNTLPVGDSAINSTTLLKIQCEQPSRTENMSQKSAASQEDITQIDKNVLSKKTGMKKNSDGEEENSEEQEVAPNEINEESDTNSRCIVEDKQDEFSSNREEFDILIGKSIAELISIDKKKEENMALTKRLDKRKGRLSFIGEEAMRVKAEAALKELNQPRKNKSLVSNARWGVNSLRFVKNCDSNAQTNTQTPCFPTSKVRFASLSDKKYKGCNPDEGITIKIEKPDSVLDEKPDIYDFNDDDFLAEKKPFSPLKDFQDLDKAKLVSEEETICSEKCKVRLNDS